MEKNRPIKIKTQDGKSVYFASDQHFGAPNEKDSKKREEIFLSWLNEIENTTDTLFLIGDLFDFWFEYKYVVPKGFVRILGKLAQLKDKGITIYFFTGNHDLWIDDYFEKELGFIVFRKKQYFEIDDKLFLIAHGDGLGPGDKGYKRMKKVFTNPISKWLYRWLHPDLGMKLGNYLSRKNKLISGNEDIIYLGEDKEWLALYSKRKLKQEKIHFFIYGHRHLPIKIQLSPESVYFNLGDWITHYSYGKYQKGNFELIINYSK